MDIMAVKLFTIGGYDEVGRNMSAIQVDDEIIILDMGFFIPKLIEYEDEEPHNFSVNKLSQLQVIPDDSILKKLKHQVKAIAIGHGHLDHVGAVPYLAKSYNAPVIATPFTLEILKSLIKDNKLKLNNELIPVLPNSSFKVSNKITLEFIHMTHSTLQTAMIAVHTPEGIIIYANDFKFDRDPVLGKKPNFERLKKLKGKVLALVADSIYSNTDQKTPSEKVAREMLKDVLLGTHNKNNLIIVSTFSSHIARLKSIADFGDKLNRKILFLGRSLHKYVTAAQNLKLIKFNRVEIVPYRSKIAKRLKQIKHHERGNYMIVCTGNQGEPNAVLSRIARGEYPLKLYNDDQVIFSCKTIPTPINYAQREILENLLKQKKVRIFKDIHVSGHPGREDLRELINLIQPKHIIPSHVGPQMAIHMVELATEIGYTVNENVHLMRNGLSLKLK